MKTLLAVSECDNEESRPCQTSNTCLPVYLLPLYRQAPPLSSSVLHSTTRSEVGTVRKCLTEVNINPTIRVIILNRYIISFYIIFKCNLKQVKFDGLKPIPSSLTPRRAAPAPVSFHEADNLTISPAA